jgi:hypothetical protein
MIGRSKRPACSKALRSRPPSASHFPSSDSATAPASRSSPYSDSSSPFWPLEIAPIGYIRARANVLAERAVVEDGVRVGHGADRREAAGRGRGEAGVDRLRVLAPRLAQVRVQVDEAGAHEQAGRVEHLRIGAARVQPLADALDETVAQENVPAGVDARGRVDQPAAAKEQPAAHSPSQGWPPSSR